MIIDSHVHLFTKKVVENVSRKTNLVQRLHLQTEGAKERCELNALKQRMAGAKVSACLLLPTAGPGNVAEANNRYYEMAAAEKELVTAGTLHPGCPDNPAEIEGFKKRGVRGIKLCSFSQGFALDAPGTLALFDLIQGENQKRGSRFFVVLDTFYEAHKFFGTDPAYTTTPGRLGNLVKSFPGIPFMAAHMAGLRAPFADICSYLPPAQNLYLDTSNAAHTLSKQEFIHLLKIHGPGHIIFGTDWPWFDPVSEIQIVSVLLEEAGYSREEKDAVFGGNIARLLGIES